MRIGILTFWESQDNYGQILQAFALKTFLQQKGHDVFIIKYHRVMPVKSIREKIVGFNLKDFVARRVTRGKQRKKAAMPSRGFDHFKEKHLTYSDQSYYSLNELKTAPPVADVYITGSDQVWNNSFRVSCEAFLLGFGESNTTRLSYAASFGMKSLDKKTRSLFKNHIDHFNGVSVREKSGVDICSEIGYNSAVWVPDPTLLFNKYEWNKYLAIGEHQAAKNNVFIYIVGELYIKDKQKFVDYANSLPGKNVYYAMANGGTSGNSFPGIEDWVKNISEADFIITNSFHGMVFSIIYNKHFIILPNAGKSMGMNERIISLLEKVHLEDHLMYEYKKSSLDILLSKKIDWENVTSILEDWKEDAETFLNESLAPKSELAV